MEREESKNMKTIGKHAWGVKETSPESIYPLTYRSDILPNVLLTIQLRNKFLLNVNLYNNLYIFLTKPKYM